MALSALVSEAHLLVEALHDLLPGVLREAVVDVARVGGDRKREERGRVGVVIRPGEGDEHKVCRCIGERQRRKESVWNVL